ncbi:sulfate permease [Propioniciclava soli]|uniref:Sulfate permease n=1 Tax=Propioniciclava soli TaxID=2775081 RepID=A0ABZ3C3R1_9ACTN
MIRLLWTASAEVRYFLRCYMPSNILLDLIRTRKGLKWGVPAMLLAGPYLVIAFWCTTLIENGGPGWLHLVVLVCLWNALKMMAIGPVSVVLLVSLDRSWRSEGRVR